MHHIGLQFSQKTAISCRIPCPHKGFKLYDSFIIWNRERVYNLVTADAVDRQPLFDSRCSVDRVHTARPQQRHLMSVPNLLMHQVHTEFGETSASIRRKAERIMQYVHLLFPPPFTDDPLWTECLIRFPPELFVLVSYKRPAVCRSDPVFGFFAKKHPFLL